MNNDLTPRIGSFFLLLAFLMLFLFVTSLLSREVNLTYLLIGSAGLLLGILFRRRAPPPPPSGRFAAIRKASEQTRLTREARQKKKDQKK